MHSGDSTETARLATHTVGLRKRGWLETINDRLEQSPLIEFFGRVAKFAVVAAVISGAVTAVQWQLEADDRAKERHYRAWELINVARGSTGDGGRRAALQDLNKDGVSLSAAPLAKAWLAEVDLERADLSLAHLEEANLQRAHLEHAYLMGACLERASLGGANLRGAYLVFADLPRASLYGADLQGADLGGADLQGADLSHANLRDAKDLTQDQLNSAQGDDRTVLSDGLIPA